jgi:hypothetical protein
MSAFKGEADTMAPRPKSIPARSQSCRQQIAEIFDILIANSGFTPAHHRCLHSASEISMALFKLPLSGDVVQWINPVTWFASGNQISTNVYLGESSSPETEAEILDRVGTYGRQLGQIADAMIVLLRHLPHRASLSPEDSKAIEAFEKMANDIADIKEKHKRQAVRP